MGCHPNPIDELNNFFRGVGQPPTTNQFWGTIILNNPHIYYIYMYVCIYHYLLHFIRTCSGMSSIPHQSMVASFVAPPFAQGAGGGSEARSHERSGVAYSSKVLSTCCQFPWIYPLDMTNSSPWFFDGRNRWFTELKNGGSFHGKLLNHQMVHGVFSQVFRGFLRHGTPNPVLTDGT